MAKETHQDRIQRLVAEFRADGWLVDDRHSMSRHGQHELFVREVPSGKLVAYSVTRADCDQSIVEFVEDYFA